MKNLTILEKRPKGVPTTTIAIRLPISVIERVVAYGQRNLLGLGLTYERLLVHALDADEKTAESEVSDNATKA